MAAETSKGTERCESHPGTVSVARCATCDRTLCIACAVPVRGVVLGPECLPAEVAAEVGPAAIAGPPIAPRWVGAGAALLLLVASTLFPWTRFGVASGWFGAWGSPLRWSTLTAVAGSIAFAIWIARRRPGRGVMRSVAALAMAAAGGALLSVLSPPPFTTASAAPWVALAGGLAAGLTLTLPRGSSVRPV